jgi:hypothetical protein
MLSACADEMPGPGTVPTLLGAEIETDAEGRCFGRDVAPAVIETITATEEVTPAILGPDGSILSPATYRTVTRQEITRERGEVAFETICPPAYTVEFVSTLQRALATRGLYRGPINGVMDTATGRAVQDFQRAEGPDSPLLSIRAARSLGIVALSQEELDRL